VDQTVQVNSVSTERVYSTCVVHISDQFDFVILKCSEKVVSRHCPIETCDVMKQFVVCGFANNFPELTFIRGTVHSAHPFVFESNARRFGPFVYGTANASREDSGNNLYTYVLNYNLF
jgi:hypothetical protein